MQQVADWLEKLGLGQYAQRFAVNDVDVAVTDRSRPIKIAVAALGHGQKRVNYHEEEYSSSFRQSRLAPCFRKTRVHISCNADGGGESTDRKPRLKR